MRNENHERVFLITGASTGIGAATARQAVAAGFRVALAARSQAKLDGLVAELGGAERAVALACDVADWDSQRQMVAAALAAFGRIDVVFANAGLSAGSPYYGGEDTPAEWREMILTNMFGPAATARLTLPELVRRRGHFLLTGSVAGRVTNTQNLYAATKWGITGMATTMRQQLVGTGVRVTLIAPGVVETPFWPAPPSGPSLQPEDVASAVLYAVSQPAHVDVNEVLLRPAGQQI